MSLITVVRRAFDVNPRALPVNAREQAALAASGIHQPAMQSYFAWRRSLMLFVIFATLVSAALSTYRAFTESDYEDDLATTLAEHLPFEMPATSDDESTEELEEEKEPQTTFAEVSELVLLVALYALPLAALAVVVLWTRFRASSRIMLAAFAFSFLVPLLLGLCPWSWWGYVEAAYSPKTQPVEYLKQQAEGLLEGAMYLVELLPTVLSLVPGVQRACIRVKMLLPQAILPGWFLVAASPFYAIFLLVLFVALNQFNSNPLVFAGMLLLVLAPLWYPLRARLFTRPLSSEADDRRIRGVQRIVGAVTALGGILLLIFLTRGEVMGVRLLGVDHEKSLLVPLDLVEFMLETLSRSMFVTALGADLFLRMNLSAWKNTREFANSPEAESYDRVMSELDQIS